MNVNWYNIAIIGAGPAGIACAIQLMRYGIRPVIFEKNEIGGLLRNANFVENYPGFPRGIRGIELVKKLEEHLSELKISPVFEEVKEIKIENDFFQIITPNLAYKSKILVVATGTTPRKLKTSATKVFYEVSELYKEDIKGKKIVIIGSGDAAFDYAINIATNTEASEVVILNRSAKTKCLPVLKQAASENKKIKYYENIELNPNAEYDYILAAIGREPELSFLDKNIISGFTQNSTAQPDCGNLFLTGDVKNGDFRQSAIAIGDGIRAAMEIYKSLS